jgi:membrane peptidoglycan carboxypeptidase
MKSKLAKLAALVVIIGVIAAGMVLPYVGGLGLIARAGADKFLDASCTLVEEPPQQRTTIVASDGKTVIASLFDQNRSVVDLKQVPLTVTNALISTEDRRFYDHHGVDVRGLMRAAVHTSNGTTQGASTLTEQYVKQVRYYQAKTDDAKAAAIDQNLDRKISDAQCALSIEKKYSKDKILEKYLNIAYFGESAYGIQTAAQTYFGVNASGLTVPEAALLVGLVKSPSSLDPFVDSQAARARRDLVIMNMADQGFISKAVAAKAKASPVKLAKTPKAASGCTFSNPAIANVGYFCDYARTWLEQHGVSRNVQNTAGLKIVTTLDAKLQNDGQKAISATTLDSKSDYLLAMPSLDPRSGAVTSMISSKRYGLRTGDPRYTVNHLFTDAYAGSGSTFKYFTALAALKSGVPPNYMLTAPSPYQIKNCPNKSYRPENAGRYNATLPLKDALPQSSNTYFVAMEDQLFGCELTPIVTTATSLGMNALLNDDPQSPGATVAQSVIRDRQPSFTLGQASTAVMELTGAFAAMANDGVFCPPVPIDKVIDSAGKEVAFKRPACSRQFDSYVARTLVNIMTADTNRNGTAVSFFRNWYSKGGSPVAGKTGTNNATSCYGTGTDIACADNGENSSLWFVGITPTLVSAAALVNPKNPRKSIQSTPGLPPGSNGTDTYGAFASTFWLAAYGPRLQNQTWTWPTPESVPGVPVPSMIGKTAGDAQAELTQLGFKPVRLATRCGSPVPFDSVASFSPPIAEPGASISLCISNGTGPDVYIPPVRTIPRRSANPGVTSPPSTAGPATQGPPQPPAHIPNPRPTKQRGGGRGGGG